jgi:hypothetical protein
MSPRPKRNAVEGVLIALFVASMTLRWLLPDDISWPWKTIFGVLAMGLGSVEIALYIWSKRAEDQPVVLKRHD